VRTCWGGVVLILCRLVLCRASGASQTKWAQKRARVALNITREKQGPPGACMRKGCRSPAPVSPTSASWAMQIRACWPRCPCFHAHPRPAAPGSRHAPRGARGRRTRLVRLHQHGLGRHARHRQRRRHGRAHRRKVARKAPQVRLLHPQVRLRARWNTPKNTSRSTELLRSPLSACTQLPSPVQQAPHARHLCTKQPARRQRWKPPAPAVDFLTFLQF